MNKKYIVLGMILLSSIAFGQIEKDSLNQKVYEIQEVKIFGQSQNQDELVTKIQAKDIYKFEKNNVVDALNLLPGISITQFGARNEGTLLLRGFDNRRTPVYYDGVPIYAPYDGNFDLSRFTTYDIENIAVEKGLVSVKFGSNAMGGAVNIVSRKPTKVFDANARLGLGFADGTGVNSYFSSVNVGTRREKYYVIGSASFNRVDDFILSKKFVTNTLQPTHIRNHSASFDSKLSAKFGYTPNKTDEYSFTILRQMANKNIAPNAVTASNSSYRDYPTYDKTSLYLKTKTRIADKTFVNFTGYYDTYYNIMKQFDNANYVLQNRNSSFSSVYDDYTLGGILTISTEIIKNNALTFTFNEKYDHHKEYNEEIPANATTGQKLKAGEPEQSYKDNTIFIGLEDVFTLNDNFKFIGGVSFSHRNNILAQDYGVIVTGGSSVLYDFPKSNENVFDYKAGVVFLPAKDHNITLSASKRSRFASQKERYSYRMGRYIPNPDLKSEYTYAFDLTYSGRVGNQFQYEVSGFINSVRNAILK